MSLKANNGYDYIQDSCFLGQQFGEVFIFKMYIDGNGNGFDLVMWMQFGGDLQAAWIMFDHVKHIQNQTTFTYHVYDLVYFKMMMIAICDM